MDDEIARLQRELLHLLGRNTQGPALKYERREGDVLALRRRLLELDPKACLYEKWGGIMPSDRDRRKR